MPETPLERSSPLRPRLRELRSPIELLAAGGFRSRIENANERFLVETPTAKDAGLGAPGAGQFGATEPLAGLSAAAIKNGQRDVVPMDVLIAGIALHRGLVMVSHDGDFARIPGLRFEDWES